MSICFTAEKNGCEHPAEAHSSGATAQILQTSYKQLWKKTKAQLHDLICGNSSLCKL